MFKSADDYRALCRLFTYQFNDLEMLAKAITRKTAWVSGQQSIAIGHQETLTYLGGDILRAIIDDLLFASNPNYAKGHLSPERDKLISKNVIAGVAEDLNIGAYILMDGADSGNFIRQGRAKILSDTLKALLAVLFLDSGRNYSLLRAFVKSHWTIPVVYTDSSHRFLPQYAPQYRGLYLSLGYKFKGVYLLTRALTRKSSVQEGLQDKALGHGETLATLGDGVLRMVMGDILLTSKPQAELEVVNEQMDKLVSNQRIAIIADRLDLDDYLVMGKGEQYNFEREGRNKILAATVEAIIGAIFLDSDRNYRIIKQFIEQHWQLIKPAPQPAPQFESGAYTSSSTSQRTYAKSTPPPSYTNTSSSRSSSYATPESSAYPRSARNRYDEGSSSYSSDKFSYPSYRSARYQPDSDSSSSDEDNVGPGLGTFLAAAGLFAAGAAAVYHFTKDDEKESNTNSTSAEQAKQQQKDKARDNSEGCLIA
jgi:dsRNA-specific ribonuclease